MLYVGGKSAERKKKDMNIHDSYKNEVSVSLLFVLIFIHHIMGKHFQGAIALKEGSF